jgi:glycosyltransferase 2 family protein
VGAEGVGVTAASPRGGRRRAIGFVAGALIVAFLIWGVVRGWDTVRSFDWELRPGWLAAGLLLLAVFYLASALGYAEIVARLHRNGPARTVVADIWARSLLGRYVPGNVLMVAGRVVLGADVGVPRRTSLAATVYEQVLALVVAAVGGVVAIAVHGEIGGGAPVWLVALVPLLLVPLHPRVFRPATTWALRRARREPLTEVLPAGAVSALVAWYAVTAVLLALGVWALVRSAAGSVAGDPVLVGGGFLLAFTVSMLVFIFPSGLGVREGAFALVLAENLPDEVAIAVAVGVRLALTAVELSFVGAAALTARGARRAEVV